MDYSVNWVEETSAAVKVLEVSAAVASVSETSLTGELAILTVSGESALAGGPLTDLSGDVKPSLFNYYVSLGDCIFSI